MAEETKAEAQESATPKKTSFLGKKRLLVFAVIGLLVIGLAGVGFFIFLSAKGGEKKEKVGKKDKDSILIDLDPIVVNLLDPTGKRYLQIRLSLEVGDKKIEEIVKKKDSKIKDVIISYLSGKTVEDVLKPTAKEEIKRELLQKINHTALGEDLVLNLYITQYIIE
ncbi:MAG: flagellar basal body-associated FliL family protein [Thermodesulfobacteriaceae bacterium]|nr:flagellar basal body-associated FliL family protein [Thermodesulfobacteriaceae bacterium]MDW8135845.1 flagellar basal body-associated FliL family protein [Thermodesulfobacterium sp.]